MSDGRQEKAPAKSAEKQIIESNPTLERLLQVMLQQDASDLHISTGAPPILRIYGMLKVLNTDPMTPDFVKKLIYGLLTEAQIAKFEKELELDFSVSLKGVGRFRVNIYRQRSTLGACFRAVNFQIKTFEDLGLPSSMCKKICDLQKGLVLVTGATGSGKTTSIASMIEYINQNQNVHIITVEDPIEYVFKNKKALITQREVGHDTHDFKNALKYVLRQDPDVVVVGEMRDLETMQAALTIAETGHLTFATLHTNDTSSTVTRIIDSFPPHQQNQVRMQLSLTLEAVLAQQLIPKSFGTGRVLSMEVLISNYAIKSLIRENKIHQIYSVLQTSSNVGMMTMNKSIFELYNAGYLSYNDAVAHAYNEEELKSLIKSAGIRQ
ncbi:MAG: type IV pilus twitching motility protein PilT [Planctomycetes bacterium]|nr:type IV pilus twitching motility protein PilT [Planctomycetota bacterium]